MPQLYRYQIDTDYRAVYIKRVIENTKQYRMNDRYNHYKKLSEDIEYLKECKSKGLRIRNCPVEFLDKINNSLEMLKVV